MKKALVLLLILAFVGVAIWAQDEAAAPVPQLSLSGRVQTGLQINGGTTGNPTIQLKDNKDSGNALDSQFKVAYGDGTTWGLAMGLGFSAANGVTATSTYVPGTVPTVTTTIGSLYLTDTYVWVKPISQLKFTIGKSAFEEFGVLTNGNGAAEPDTTNLRMDILPIDGLLLSAYLPIAIAAGDIANNVSNMAFGAKYAMPQAFNVAVEYFLMSSDAVANFTGAAATGSGQFVASAGLDAVENLTVQASVNAIMGSTYTTTIYENVAYNFGFIKPQVYSTQAVTAAGTEIMIKPQLSFYIVEKILNPSAAFAYTIPAVGASNWKLTLANTFDVGNNGIKVAFDLMGSTAITWDVKISYNLNWSN